MYVTAPFSKSILLFSDKSLRKDLYLSQKDKRRDENMNNAKENLITQFLLKVADKIGNGELAFLRDQLSAVLFTI